MEKERKFEWDMRYAEEKQMTLMDIESESDILTVKGHDRKSMNLKPEENEIDQFDYNEFRDDDEIHWLVNCRYLNIYGQRLKYTGTDIERVQRDTEYFILDELMNRSRQLEYLFDGLNESIEVNEFTDFDGSVIDK